MAYAVSEEGLKKGFEFIVTEGEKTSVIKITNVDMKTYAGKARDVVIENFDGAYSYVAKFTYGTEE